MEIVMAMKQKGATMLVELKDVEAYIEPREILQQALQEGDISVDYVVRACIDEEGNDAVLEAFDHDVIKEYCIQRDINIELKYFDQISAAVKEFNNNEKAMLLWKLLQCQEV